MNTTNSRSLHEVKSMVYSTVAAHGSFVGCKMSQLIEQFKYFFFSKFYAFFSLDWGIELVDYAIRLGYPNVLAMVNSFSDRVVVEENSDEPKIFPVPVEATAFNMSLIDATIRLHAQQRQMHMAQDDGYDSD